MKDNLLQDEKLLNYSNIKAHKSCAFCFWNRVLSTRGGKAYYI